MSLSEPADQRLSDTERDEAAEALRTHFEAGRLTSDEFDERLTAALQARTAGEGVRLFADLPAPHPGWVDAAQPGWATYPGLGAAAPEPGSPADWRSSGALDRRGVILPSASTPGQVTPPAPAGPVQPVTPADFWLGAMHGVIWPVAILWVIFGDGPWWLIIVAIVASAALGGAQEQRRKNRREPPPYQLPQ